MPTPTDPLVLHATLRGWLGAVLTPLALLGLGLAGVARSGWAAIPSSMLLLAAALTLIVLLDLPRRTRFDDEGIERICLLRRHRLPWARIRMIDRTRPGLLAVHPPAIGTVAAGGPFPPVVTGGLVARGSARRTWLLTDGVESRDEYARLSALLQRPGIEATLRAPEPHPATPPTGLYRRSATEPERP